MGLLYRGVCDALHDENGGKLCPKGDKSMLTMSRNGKLKRNLDIKLDRQGPTEQNAVRLHHHESGLYGGCFLSFTRSEATARKFATRGLEGERTSGYVYVIDEEYLAAYGIIAHEVDDPLHPNEQEVTLRSANNGELPPGLVVRKSRVEAEDV